MAILYMAVLYLIQATIMLSARGMRRYINPRSIVYCRATSIDHSIYIGRRRRRRRR